MFLRGDSAIMTPIRVAAWAPQAKLPAITVPVLQDTIRSVLQGMVPSGCFFSVGAIVESADKTPLTGLHSLSRQNEFAAGRHCARVALEVSGFSGWAALKADSDGVPVWPAGWIGSISHSRDIAAAVTARIRQYRYIGLDLEKTNRLRSAAMARVIHEEEAGFAQNDPFRTSILFSLKEAFYKAQFPRYRTTANFQDLALSIHSEKGSARVAVLSPRFADDLRHMRFVYRLIGDYVVSLCWLDALNMV